MAVANASTKLRWSKFWWKDWQGDQALRSCSIGARGLWMDMLCIAHEGEPHGFVTINGKPVSTARLAGIAGISEKITIKLLDELDDAGVFSKKEGVIFSRRMVRDREASEIGKANGLTGGNPTLKPSHEAQTDAVEDNAGGYEGGLTPGVKLEAEAEARGKTREEEIESIPPTPKQPGAEKTVALRTPRKKPCCALPQNWIPSTEGLRLAVSLGLPEITIARFTDHHRSKGNLMADWDAAWRTWCNSPYNKPAAGRAASADANDAAIARLQAELSGSQQSQPEDFFAGPTIDGATA